MEDQVVGMQARGAWVGANRLWSCLPKASLAIEFSVFCRFIPVLVLARASAKGRDV